MKKLLAAVRRITSRIRYRPVPTYPNHLYQVFIQKATEAVQQCQQTLTSELRYIVYCEDAFKSK